MIPVEIKTVEFPNLFVIHQEQAQFALLETKALKQPVETTAYLPAVYGDFFLPIFDQDSHRRI